MFTFNPTMVWFYRVVTKEDMYDTYSFQSHYGLILSVIHVWQGMSTHNPFNPTMVWFYREHRPVADRQYVLLSIPLWSDFINLIFSYTLNNPFLSIPLWSDFIQLLLYQRKYQRMTFQSHYGLILSYILCKVTKITEKSFNPTMVWFYQTVKLPSKHDLIELSIPLWSDFIMTWKR